MTLDELIEELELIRDEDLAGNEEVNIIVAPGNLVAIDTVDRGEDGVVIITDY